MPENRRRRDLQRGLSSKIELDNNQRISSFVSQKKLDGTTALRESQDQLHIYNSGGSFSNIIAAHALNALKNIESSKQGDEEP